MHAKCVHVWHHARCGKGYTSGAASIMHTLHDTTDRFSISDSNVMQPLRQSWSCIQVIHIRGELQTDHMQGVHVSPRLQQHLHSLPVTLGCCPMQRGIASLHQQVKQASSAYMHGMGTDAYMTHMCISGLPASRTPSLYLVGCTDVSTSIQQCLDHIHVSMAACHIQRRIFVLQAKNDP